MASKLTSPSRPPCRPPRRLPRLSRPAPHSNLLDPFSSSAIQFSREHITLHQYDENVVRELSIPPDSIGHYWNPPRSNGSSIGITTETPSFSFTHQHALTNPSTRLRTPQNLIARHGLPSTLPPPPRTTYTQPQPVEINLEQIDSFLTNHYRAMRQENTPAVATPTAPSAPLPSGMSRLRPHVRDRRSLTSCSPTVEVDPFDAFIHPDSYTEADLFASASDGAQQLGLSLWEISPDETPLDTPEDHFGSPTADGEDGGLFGLGMPLFGAEIKPVGDSKSCTATGGLAAESLLTLDDLVNYACPPSATLTASPQTKLPAPPAMTPPTPSLLDQAIYTMDQTPALGTTPLPPDTLPLRPSVPAFHAPSTPTRHTRPLPTGIRKNITVDKLVPLDAPTQSRVYTSESATSRKAVPAAFRKKRAHAEIAEDEVTPEDEGAIYEKRRKNTLAARKSRARKLETMTQLQDHVATLTTERDYWQARAYAAEETLQRHGLNSPSMTTTT